MTDKVVCPKCGSAQIEKEDCFDIYFPYKEVRKCYVGTCKNCGEEVQWDKVYQFIGYEIEGD